MVGAFLTLPLHGTICIHSMRMDPIGHLVERGISSYSTYCMVTRCGNAHLHSCTDLSNICYCDAAQLRVGEAEEETAVVLGKQQLLRLLLGYETHDVAFIPGT